MSRFIPVLPFNYIPASRKTARISENKLVALLMIVAVNSIFLLLVYPLVAAV